MPRVPHSSAPVRVLKQRLARGFALGEMLLAVAAIAVLIGITAVVYSSMRSSAVADEAAASLIQMAVGVQKSYNNAPSYSGLNAAALNELGLVQKPLKYDGTVLRDGWGNTMNVSGGTTHFGVTVGGTDGTALSQTDCAAIANRLASTRISDRMEVGTAAAIYANGNANAGKVQAASSNAFVVGNSITQASLTSGCSEPAPVIAFQVPR